MKKVALLVQPPHGQGVNIIAFKISSLCTRHLSHADSYTVDKFDLGACTREQFSAMI